MFISYWAELKKAVYNTVIRPYQIIIERTVKNWIREVLLPLIPAEVRKAAGMLLVADAIADDAKNVDCWMDALQFAIKLYRLIPDDVKDAIKDLTGLPQLDLGEVCLPDYRLDAKNTFLAVSLYNNKEFSAGLVAIAADRNGKSGVYLLPVVKASYDTKISLGETHELDVWTGASVNEGIGGKKSGSDKEITKQLEKGAIGLFLSEPERFDLPGVELISSADALKAYLELVFKRREGKELYICGYDDDDSLIRIKMKDYPQKAYVGFNKDGGGLDAGYLGKVEGLEFTLALAGMNAFFEKILRGDIVLGLDELYVGYGLQKGLTFGGDANVHIPLKPSLDLNFLKFDNLSLDLGSGGGLHFRGLSLCLNLNFSADLSAVSFTFPDMGFGFDINFLTPDFHFGDFDFSPVIKFPDGLGISIDVEDLVKGSGFVKWNLDKGEFLGGFELAFLSKFSAGALFILNTKMPDGSKGYSFIGAVSVFFKPGIQLGLGFSLTGIGASLGLNRLIDTNKMRDAVYDGSLEAVMFVKDLESNLSTALANMTSFYPVSEDHFFFGAMVRITWAEILDFTCGVFIQVPDVVVVIAGGVHLNISDTLEKLISLNANFISVFDAHKGISLDASLYDSRLVGIDFHGSIALRVYWAGDTKGFLLSAGGFHPSYTPEPGFNVPSMQRIGFSFNIGPVSLSNESYFAVTSNTVQFGSDTRLQLGWDKFGISGYMYYNVLFQFNPFKFMFDVGIGASVKMGSLTLMSISLALDVSGPAPWHIAGKAGFTIFFVTFHVNFSHTWGKKQQISDKKYLALLPILQDAFEDNDNWNVIRCDVVDGLVATYVPEQGSFVMCPSDTIAFSQEWIPFNRDLEKYGEAYPADTDRIDIEKVWIQGDQKTEYSLTQTLFAPSQIKKMTDSEKLEAKSYELMDAGFQLNAGQEMRSPDKGNPMTFTEKDKVYTVESGSWDAWQKLSDQYAAKSSPAAKTTTVTKKTVALPKKRKAYVYRHKSDSSLRKGFDQGFILRPASRRDKAGFERYLADLDNMMAYSLRSYVDRLNTKDKLK